MSTNAVLFESLKKMDIWGAIRRSETWQCYFYLSWSTHMTVGMQIACKTEEGWLYFTRDGQAWWTGMLPSSLSLTFSTLLIKLFLVPGWEKVITGPVYPSDIFFLGLSLIISHHHVSRIMLTLAVLMKKLHLQLSEDIRLTWPFQLPAHTNHHSTLSNSKEFLLYFYKNIMTWTVFGLSHLNQRIIRHLKVYFTKMIALWIKKRLLKELLFPTLCYLISNSQL